MKLNPVILALSLGACVISGAALAATPANVPLAPARGTVSFAGEINNAPCSISAATQHQNIPMGSVAAHVLAHGGQGRQNPFTIQLQDCDLSDSSAKTVSATFLGEATTAGDLFAMPGNVGGVGLMLSDANGTQIQPNHPSSATHLVVGDNTLRFNAALQGLNDASNPVKPATFATIIDFQMNYQ
jgi:type 1 fimbria pilin